MAKKKAKKVVKKHGKRSGLVVKREPLEGSSQKGDSLRNIFIAVVFFAILISAVFFLRGSPPIEEENEILELTETDFITDKSITASQLTFFGTRLGDSTGRILDVLGEPDNFKEFQDGTIVNFYYSERFGCETECVIFNIIDGNVTRITFFNALNDNLVGESKLIHNKSWVYFNVGIPDTFIDLAAFRRFIYSDRGIELFVKRKWQVGLSLFEPDPSKARVASKDDPVVLEVTSGMTEIESIEAVEEDLPELDNTTFGIY